MVDPYGRRTTHADGARPSTNLASSQKGSRVKTTPHTSIFHSELHAHAWLKFGSALIPSHPCFMRIVVVVSDGSLFDDSIFLLPHHLLSYHPVLSSARQLHFPGCGGQIPCAHPPSTSLPQVMSPTTTTSRKLMNTTPRNPRSSSGPRMTSTTMTSPSARRSLMRAEDEPITLKKKVCRPVCSRPSVMIER